MKLSNFYCIFSLPISKLVLVKRNNNSSNVSSNRSATLIPTYDAVEPSRLGKVIKTSKTYLNSL